jgi:hypothetical protein
MLAAAAVSAFAQAPGPGARAEALEQQEQWSASAAAYREALAEQPASLEMLLGLERVYDQLGLRDSLVPLIERAVALEPHNTALRGLQLRTLAATRGRGATRAAYDAWRAAAPEDPAPYRAYARLLLAQGDARAADTVLREAAARTGDARGFAYETATLRASMGLWQASAQAWRQAVADRPYFAQAAAYSLLPAPIAQRDAVRAALSAAPPVPGARAVLAQLELSWGDPRAAWNALRPLPPDSLGLAAWRDFAERAEANEAWLAARDALLAAAAARNDGELYARAARDALRAGDARGADTLAAIAMQRMDSAFATGVALPVRVEALSQLGRGADAERMAAAYARWTAPDERAEMARRVAWAWVRAGDIPRARAALEAAGADAGEAGGWLALYDGDLAGARKRLKPERARTADELAAAALLGRSAAERSPAAGKAFLALARGDSAAAARHFERAALELPDAAPLLLSLAARLDAARGDDAAAVPIWRRILEQAPASPEAPASELEWARALRREHKDAEAIERLEHLILTYPESALLPQARRELDAARHALPVAS